MKYPGPPPRGYAARVDWGEATRTPGRRAPARRVKPHRSFDPRRVANLESAAWAAYYRREWLKFLRHAISLTRHTFGLPWPQTLYAAWLARRAIQLWSPYPNNDPDGARQTMERFYGLLARHHQESLDPVEAARLEVEWWRIHREHQYGGSPDDGRALVDALARLYAFVYGVPESQVRVAAEQRALAMGYSDRWVTEGRELTSPLLDQERAALVRSYAGLLAAIHRP